VEGGGGGLTVSGVSRNRGGFVKCVAIQKRLGIPGLYINGRRKREVAIYRQLIIVCKYDKLKVLTMTVTDQNYHPAEMCIIFGEWSLPFSPRSPYLHEDGCLLGCCAVSLLRQQAPVKRR
jgi:hypothetical protein